MANVHSPPLIPQMLANALARSPNRLCITTESRAYTYGEAREITSQLQQAQGAAGLQAGSRVAVLSKNRPEVLLNMAATMVNGCILTPLHPLGSLDDHAYALADAEIDCLVFDPVAFGARVRRLHQRLPTIGLLSFGPSGLGTDYLNLAASFAPRELEPANVTEFDLCVIAYTGGTTGSPKGVMLSQRAWMTQTIIQMTEWEMPDEVRMLLSTSLSHAAMSTLLPVLMKGGSIHVLERFDPDAFYDAVCQEKITATMLVPAMMYALQSHDRYVTADVSSLELILYGASPVNPDKLADAIRTWGPIFHQFYGQTEAPTVIANLRRSDHDLDQPERLASCGRPASWITVATLGPDGSPTAADETGEICIKGPLVMEGYKGLDALTNQTLAGGWLHTGDIGRFDDEGYLYIVDREKDVIVTGGFNVYPREVEDVLGQHSAVSMSVVVGVPDAKWGEAVRAVVKLRPGFVPNSELANELVALVKESKGSIQTPKSIDFVDDIPLTPVGKPDKKLVRNEFWKSEPRSVS